MPPSNSQNALGWKAFFALLMLLQGIGTAMMFRTYDAVQTLTVAKVQNEVMVNNIILPTLTRHETAIESLKRGGNVGP